MKKRIIILAVSLIIVTGIIIGVSYAFFSTGGTQETANTFQSECLNISLTDASASINLNNIYPITDIEGLDTTSYDFTITNTCNTDANYEINLESLNQVANSLSADYIKVSLSSDTVGNIISILSDNSSVTPKIDGAYEAYNLYTGTLKANETKTYHLKLWLDYDATVEVAANKVYQSKINVIANPEIQVVDNLEATFSSGGLSVVIDASANEVNNINYCSTNDNICNPSKQTEVLNNKSLIEIGNEKNVATTLGTLNVINTDKYMVCTKLNETSKIICSNPINTEMDFGRAIEEQDKNICMYDSHYVYDVTTSRPAANEENCQNVYFTGIPGMEYVDKTVEAAFSTLTYIPIGDWNEDEQVCTYNGITVTDMIGNPIIDKNRCKDIYTDGTDYVALTKIGSGVFAKSAGSTGLYEEKTQRGSTYYYRGNITNNYLVFAGFYWRIIRINEDGTLRLIYSGIQSEIDNAGKETILNNNYDDTETGYKQIGKGDFNNNYTTTDNTYVGYMYGTPGSDTYEETHANSNDSTIKTTLDTWFQEHLLNYSEYLDGNAGFCGDRSAYIENGWPNYIPGGGINRNDTTYGAFKRYTELSYNTELSQSTDNILTFECNNVNDIYTTKESYYGNRALTYPIGLISLDEALYTGQSQTYLNSGTIFWTMSPGFFGSDGAFIEAVGPNGLIDGYSPDTNERKGIPTIRPVINLRSDVTITGSGTIEDPYVVQTD